MTQLLAALGPLLGRLLLSSIFFYSGVQKWSATGRAASAIAGRGLPFATIGAYASGTFELLAGVLLVLGLKTRVTAVACFLYVVAVSWLFHWHPALRGDHAQTLQLLKNAGVAGGMLLLASHGPGTASVDRG
jgi:putative oxidoreductase